MALVNVVNMVVLDNPTCFTSPFQFEITFECLQELDDDLEWKVLYVGSAQDAAKDQILDEILVGPVPVGVNKFVLQADAPDPSQLAQDDLLGVTVVLVTCSYKDREFVRVGYYVNNEYHDPNAVATAANAEQTQTQTAADEPPPPIPNPVPLDRIQRHILADKPRVTKFPISWGDEPQNQSQQQNQTQNQQNQNQFQQHQIQFQQSTAVVVGSSVGAAMMADHAAATGAAASIPPPVTVTPTISSHNPDATVHGNANDNGNGNSNAAMQEDGDNDNDNDNDTPNHASNDKEEPMEEEDIDDEEEEGEEDIMDDEELSVDSETGERAGDGIVSMPEESNMSHAYFGGHHHSGGTGGNAVANASGGSGNVEAMAE